MYKHLTLPPQLLMLLGFLIQVQIIMWRRTLWVWQVQNLTLVMITCMLAMVRVLLSLILLTLTFSHPNTHLHYPTFYMFLP
jgi:hypothetical protein